MAKVLKNYIIAEPLSFREFCVIVDTVELSLIGRAKWQHSVWKQNGKSKEKFNEGICLSFFLLFLIYA